MKQLDFNEKDIKEFLKLINHDKQTELRAIIPKTDTKIFHFSNNDDLIAKCKELNGTYNLYLGINERSENGTKTDDVVSISLIPMDVDSENKPATEEDLKDVKEVVENITADFVEAGYQKPSIIFSGNGYQLYSKIPKIEINDTNRKNIAAKINSFGETLIKRYSTKGVRLDNIYDLPRIMRIPGTINIKSKTQSKIVDLNKKEDSVLGNKIKKQEIEQTEIKKYDINSSSIGTKIPIESIHDFKDFKKVGANEYQGPRLCNECKGDSKTNFDYNTEKNVWKCWHHNTGGDSLTLIAVKEGLIECKDCRKGTFPLTGTIFNETLSLAKYKYHIDIDKLLNFSKDYKKEQLSDYDITQEEINNLESFQIVNAEDVETLDCPEANYLVQELLIEGGLNIIAGKSGTYKSITSIYLARCLAAKLTAFNKHPTNSNDPILYINEENNWSIFKPMDVMVSKGIRTYHDKDAIFKDLNFVTFESLSLDPNNRAGRAKLEKAIIETGAKILICDSLKRFINFEENDANKVNEWYSFVIKPLQKKYGLTIILIHHTRKDAHGSARFVVDKKDLLRGSSDFVNIADNILFFEKKAATKLQFEMFQIKNRLDAEFEPKTVRMVASKEGGFGFTIEEGEENKNETGKCSDEILEYIFRNNLKVFSSTQETKDLFKKAGYQYGTYNNARLALIEEKVLINPKKGAYDVDWNHSWFLERQRKEDENIQTKLSEDKK